MAGATFTPSNAGSQLTAQTFGIAQGFQNIYARAEALKQSEARFEQEKIRYAQENILAGLNTKSAENRLKEQNNRLALQQIELEYKGKEADRKFRTAQTELEKMDVAENTISELSTDISRWDSVDLSDPAAALRVSSEVNAKYGLYSADPRVADKLAPLFSKLQLAEHNNRATFQKEADLMIAQVDALDYDLPLADQLAALNTPEMLQAIGRPGEGAAKLREVRRKKIEEIRKRREEETKHGNDLEIATGKAESKARSDNQKRVETLRKEIRSDAQLKTYLDAKVSYDKVASTLNSDDFSAATDMAAIFSFMKTLDPTSVVRESEYRSAETAGAILDRVTNIAAKVAKGAKLSPAQRLEFKDAAERIFAAHQDIARNRVETHAKFAREDGVDPNKVLPDDFLDLLSADEGGAAETATMELPDGSVAQGTITTDPATGERFFRVKDESTQTITTYAIE